MGESAAPFGESDTRRPARKKIFELTTASPADFFTHISSRLVLSNVWVYSWWGNNSDRIGRVQVLGIGIGSLLLGILLTLTAPLPLIILGIGLVTIGMFTVQSVTPTHLGDLAPDDKPTLAVLYQTFFYFGGAMGTILPAVAWQYGKYTGVGMLAFGLVVLGVVPLALVLRRK